MKNEFNSKSGTKNRKPVWNIKIGLFSEEFLLVRKKILRLQVVLN